MSFNWEGYFTLADGLIKNPTVFGVDEAAFRCATSRAYYAAFCSARNIALTKHGLVITGSSNAHFDVANHFSLRRTTLEQRIGRHLKNLRWRRNQADYDDLITNSTPSKMANEALELARRILVDLRSVR